MTEADVAGTQELGIVGAGRSLRILRFFRIVRTLRVFRLYRAFHKHYADATTQVLLTTHYFLLTASDTCGCSLWRLGLQVLPGDLQLTCHGCTHLLWLYPLGAAGRLDLNLQRHAD